MGWVLWRDALAGCSGGDALAGALCSGGVLAGCSGGVLCFHRRGLRKGLEGQLWAGCSGGVLWRVLPEGS